MMLRTVLIATLLAGAVVATPATAAAERSAEENGVTLITGDRVLVTGARHRIEPGPGRQVNFASQVRDGHLYVIPSDAAPLIAEGALDRRLFDVTQLLEWGYGDADRSDIPVISQGSTGLRATRKLSALGMSATRLPKAEAAATWRNLTSVRTLAGGTKLWLDGRKSYSLAESVRQIGAPQAWQQGFTGKGVTVAVLDSGYDADHPDLKDAVVHARNFSDDPDISDPIGHGTHVASTVAGRGGTYRGVAPEANLAIGKVGGANGPTDSAILAGMEWAAMEVKAKVVNMSIGDVDGPELDPLEQAVNTLSERTGTLFVVAAGNEGASGGVGTPGSAEAALTVGAVDKQGVLAPFSSVGPRVGDHAIKPDVTAPGVAIMAAAPSGGHQIMSGTSMAAPHVVGAAAILAQRHPDWTGARLKAALVGSAKPADGATPYQQGTGLVDLERGLKQQVTATGELWAAFPWDDDARTATRTITYANASDAPITLDLTTQSEVLKPSAAQVTVPAKGEATVALAIDATGKAPGDYPGVISATSGDTVVRTPAGAYVEPESYDVTIELLDKQGQPTAPMFAEVYDAKTSEIHTPAFRQGVAKIRLPKGDWNLYAFLEEDVDGAFVQTLADLPVKVDSDRRLTVDARQGRAAKVTLDDPNAQLKPGYSLGLEHGAWSSWVFGGDDVSAVHAIPSRNPGLTYTLGTTWVSKDVSPSPFVYDVHDRHADGIPEDLTHEVRQRDLAKVTVTYRASGVAATGRPLTGLQFSDRPGRSLMSPVGEIALPGTVVYYRTPGLTYESGIEVGTSRSFDGGKVARPGASSEVWNAAVTGPSFLLPGGSRTGNRLTFSGVGMLAAGGPDRTGMDSAATGTVTLARNGSPLATGDIANCRLNAQKGCGLQAELPAGGADYTLTASVQREVPYSTLTTGTESVWRFRSKTTAKEQPLPLMAVRYAPEGLDDHNRAKPGSKTRVPLWVERNPGAAKASVTSMRLEMSTGAGWRQVPVVRDGTRWTAVLPNPAQTGFVSLRATVSDSSGAAVTQTITRAYAVG